MSELLKGTTVTVDGVFRIEPALQASRYRRFTPSAGSVLRGSRVEPSEGAVGAASPTRPPSPLESRYSPEDLPVNFKYLF